jgi:hypothetical protein
VTTKAHSIDDTQYVPHVTNRVTPGSECNNPAIWALYLSEQWITYHWRDKPWNDRFIVRINDLADFTDRIALRLLKKDDFAVEAWHTLQVGLSLHSRVADWLHGPSYWLSSIEPCFECKK